MERTSRGGKSNLIPRDEDKWRELVILKIEDHIQPPP